MALLTEERQAQALAGSQIQHRFGDLPDQAVDRIDRADVDTLEHWSYRVLDATVLEDVFPEEEPSQE